MLRRLVTFLSYIIADNKRLQTTTNGSKVHPTNISSVHNMVPYIINNYRDVKRDSLPSR